MSRATLKVIVAVAITLTAGTGVANAASTGIPLDPAPSSQADPVGAQAAPIGVSPGSGNAAQLACLVQSISYGAKYCMS